MSVGMIREEIEEIVQVSGYKRIEKELVCPLVKIIKMRHKDVDVKLIHKAFMEIYSRL